MSAPQNISRTVDRLDKSGSPARVLILALVLIGELERQVADVLKA